MGKKNDVKICAVVPARGGSKGVKNKNIRDLNGRPLVAYSIEAALSCKEVDLCVLSTDSPEAAEIGRQLGVEVIPRPVELAQDASRSEDVVRHVLAALAERDCCPDHVVLLQPTSPLRTSAHITAAIKMYLAAHAASCVSVTEAEHHPYKCFISDGANVKPLQGTEFLSMPRQSLPKVLRQNGAIYIIDVAKFRVADSFYIEPAVFLEMANEDSVDIDSELDFTIAASRMTNRAN